MERLVNAFEQLRERIGTDSGEIEKQESNLSEPVDAILQCPRRSADLAEDYSPAVWNRPEMLSRMMDDEDLLKQVISTFLENAPLQMQTLKNFLLSGDIQGCSRQVHTIKGSSANVAAERLRAVALEMEKEAKAGNLDGVRARMGPAGSPISAGQRNDQRSGRDMIHAFPSVRVETPIPGGDMLVPEFEPKRLDKCNLPEKSEVQTGNFAKASSLKNVMLWQDVWPRGFPAASVRSAPGEGMPVAGG